MGERKTFYLFLKNTTGVIPFSGENLERITEEFPFLWKIMAKYRLDVGITVNSGRLRNTVQSKWVHRTLGIPEFPKTNQREVMMYLRLTNW